jgi:hypothetical protein
MREENNLQSVVKAQQLKIVDLERRLRSTTDAEQRAASLLTPPPHQVMMLPPSPPTLPEARASRAQASNDAAAARADLLAAKVTEQAEEIAALKVELNSTRQRSTPNPATEDRNAVDAGAPGPGERPARWKAIRGRGPGAKPRPAPSERALERARSREKELAHRSSTNDALAAAAARAVKAWSRPDEPWAADAVPYESPLSAEPVVPRGRSTEPVRTAGGGFGDRVRKRYQRARERQWR